MALVATGFFDGVHIGHRLILDRLVSAARERGEESIVLSFWPHPRMVLGDDAGRLRLLSTPEEKRELVLSSGVDRFEILEFTPEFGRLTAGQFLKDVVSDRFGAGGVVLGYDHRIGSDGLETEKLASLAESLGLDVIRPEKVLSGEDTVSSTAIRNALLCGDVYRAARMLGRPYSVGGEVVKGKQLGRTIGFPTANMLIREPLKMLPAEGVYAVEVEVPGGTFRGMCNVGKMVETNIFDFDGNLYGSDIKVNFLRRIRDEIQFNSLDLLKSQLRVDREACLLPIVDGNESKL